MSESEDINNVVAALKKVPPKHLLIIEIANKLPLKNGEFDYDAVSDMQLEINLATAEAKSYGGNTIQAIDALIRLRDRGED